MNHTYHYNNQKAEDQTTSILLRVALALQKSNHHITTSSGIEFFLIMASAQTTLLTGKTAIVTGGTRGIGKGISHELALRGANVAMIYMNSATASAANAYALELQALGSGVRAVAIQADISNIEEIPTIVSEALKQLEVKTIDILGTNPPLRSQPPCTKYL
jgi:S-adenosylhomocysteine hydrolase